MQDITFRVTFECQNCGECDWLPFVRGQAVDQEDVWVTVDDGVVKCQTCDSQNIRIRKREPITSLLFEGKRNRFVVVT